MSKLDLPDIFFERLNDLRGGCRCGHPDVSPPCWVCETVMDDQEANAILSELAQELPLTQVLDMQRELIENDYDGTIDVYAARPSQVRSHLPDV